MSQQAFCDTLNRNATADIRFEPIVPAALAAPAAPSEAAPSTDVQATDVQADLFKRRLSEVAWSHSMEVSEEKRYKTACRHK
jgi:hypothetical protein